MDDAIGEEENEQQGLLALGAPTSRKIFQVLNITLLTLYSLADTDENIGWK